MARRSPFVLLAVLLFALVVAAGPLPDDLEYHVEPLPFVIERRQNNDTTPVPPPSPPPAETTTTIPPPPPPVISITKTQPAPTTDNTPPPSATPPPASSPRVSTPTSSPTRSAPESTPPSSVKSTLPPTTRPVETIFTTRSGNNDITITSTSLVIETPVIDVPAPAGLSGGKDGGSSGGLDTKQKNIIIGVVVGVGGAILLAALGIVLFRLRKKRSHGIDNDDLMTGGRREGSPLSGSRKEGSELGASPFQATLDQYHRQPVNPSANF